MCGWIFDTVIKINAIGNFPAADAFKQWSLSRIEMATRVNEWLDASPLNYKAATKHPVPEGHALWAAHIVDCLNHAI